MPLPEEVKKFYENYYTHKATSNNNNNYFRKPGVHAVLKSVLGSISINLKDRFWTDCFYLEGVQPGRLLDVGCGNGGLLCAAASIGWKSHGIDFDPKAVEEACSHPDISASIGGLLGHKFPAESFDAVTMNNVMEHLPDPKETLAECLRVLRPGGRLVVVTPNVKALGHKIFGENWRGLEPPRHLFLFAPGTLSSLAKLAGFSRAHGFSTSGGARYLFWVSNNLSVQAGLRPKNKILLFIYAQLSRMLALSGLDSGEWTVLIAEA